MGKERKVQLGASNNRIGFEGSVNTASSVASQRSHTHKLITPAEFRLPKASKAHLRKIEDASSFRPGKIYVRDFKTSYSDEFQDPKTLKVIEYGVDTEASQKAWQESRRAARLESLRKLGGLAVNKFGNMGNMLRAFKKNTGDSISLVEFAEHLRRRNLDVLFPAEDQEMLFEALKASEPGVDVPTMGNLLKLVNESDPSYSTKEHNSDMMAMRDFLADQVAKHKSGEQDTNAEKKHYSREEEHADLMRKAVGQKTFGIDIKAEEMDELVDDLQKQKHTNQAHAKFSRFLRLTNMKLHAAPFYDMRNDTLEWRKKHVAAVQDRLDESQNVLSSTKQRERNAQDTVLNRSISLAAMTMQKELLNSHLSHSSSTSAIMVGPRSGGLSQYSALSQGGEGNSNVTSGSALAPAADKLAAAATPIRKPTSRNLAGSMEESGALEAAARLTLGLGSSRKVDSGRGPGPGPSSPASPSSLSPSERAVGSSPDAAMMRSSSGFPSPTLDSSDFVDQRMRLERARTPEVSVGKRSTGFGPTGVMDWHRVGHGGDVMTPRNVKGLSGGEGEYRGRYHTTNGDYYPPLIYRPSMPVERELISDADARVAMKAERRNRRHLRLSENLAITQMRVERQRLESEVRETRRSQKVNDDMINYSTTVFLNDLKGFKKQPLQMMMKKPNLTKSDHIWGGNISRSGLGREADEGPRDFTTTYSGSFAEPSKQGKIVATLDLDERVSAIFGRGM